VKYRHSHGIDNKCVLRFLNQRVFLNYAVHSVIKAGILLILTGNNLKNIYKQWIVRVAHGIENRPKVFDQFYNSVKDYKSAGKM
jgi:hypothetical protein